MLEDLPDENGRVVCENRGTGIPAMLEALRAAGMEPPRFEDRRTTFRVSFSNASFLNENTIAWLNRFAAYDLSDPQRLALAYARREGKLAHADYRRINPSLDSAEVTRQLSDLVRRGLLSQHGVRRWTYYTLPPLPSAEPSKEEAVRGAEGLRPGIPFTELGTQGGEVAILDDKLGTQEVEPGTQRGELSTQSQPVYVEISGLARRSTVQQVRAAILHLCAQRPLSPRELAELLGRNRSGLQQRFLYPLISEALLERLGSSPHDPNGRYRTTDLGRAWLAQQHQAAARASDHAG
jgi:ATP-dependent DNA helicase RecG